MCRPCWAFGVPGRGPFAAGAGAPRGVLGALALAVLCRPRPGLCMRRQAKSIQQACRLHSPGRGLPFPACRVFRAPPGAPRLFAPATRPLPSRQADSVRLGRKIKAGYKGGLAFPTRSDPIKQGKSEKEKGVMGVFAKAKARASQAAAPPLRGDAEARFPLAWPWRLRRAGPSARIACAACACRPTFPASALQIFHFL